MTEYAREGRESREREPLVRARDCVGTSAAFVAGLQAMSENFDALVHNFGYVAALLRGSSDETTAVISGMIEYASRLREAGEAVALSAIERESGVPVMVEIDETRSFSQGLVVGLEGAEYFHRRRAFKGVAVVPNKRGQEAFIRVWVTPNGHAYLRPRFHQFDFPETRRLMEDLFPARR